MASPTTTRRWPVGAEILGAGGTDFRVWAPAARTVEVVFEGARLPPARLQAEVAGYFSAAVAAAGAGTRYRFRLDAGEALPDPASRWQPDGPHGPSEVVDPGAFRWSDAEWSGPRARGRSCTSCTSAPSRRRAPMPRPRRTCPTCASSASRCSS